MSAACLSCRASNARLRQFKTARPRGEVAESDGRFAQDCAVILLACEPDEVVDPEALAPVEINQMCSGLRRVQRNLCVTANGGPMIRVGQQRLPDPPALIGRIDAELANARNIIPPIKRTYRPGILCVKCHGSNQSSVAYRDITVAARGTGASNQRGLVNARAVEPHRTKPRERTVQHLGQLIERIARRVKAPQYRSEERRVGKES